MTLGAIQRIKSLVAELPHHLRAHSLKASSKRGHKLSAQSISQDTHHLSHFSRRVAILKSIPVKVHLVKRKLVKELFLGLFGRVGIGGRSSPDYFFRDTKEFSQLVYLRLV